VKAITELSKDDAAAIQHFEQSADGVVKIKLCDKLKSLDSLAKRLGLLAPESEEAAKIPALQLFIRGDDNQIRELQDSGRLALDEPTPGVMINVVDARLPAED